ncbi:hypothetical protein ABIB83_007961 [Bradyrhizobium sp. I1.8.5]|uniref:toll/interleukin-1 receptor domain-containing protein n=1 Tax=Bradyrhizobium sp. I1.8.5 TaxID=3156365 RepID=UPI003391828D
MTPQTVEISFWPNEGRIAGSQPDLTGVGELVSQTYPSKVVFEACASPDAGTACDLEVTFAPAAAPGADAFRKAVIRLEGEIGFQALWGTAAREDRSAWSYLTPQIHDVRLPSGKPLAFNLPMASIARRLLDQARVRDATFSYRVELVRTVPHPDRARPLIPALAEVLQGGTSMRGLAAGLQDVLELARREGWHATESFGTADTNGVVRAWLEEAILQNVTDAIPILRRDIIAMRWLPRNGVSIEADDLDSFALGLRPRDYVRTAIDNSSGRSQPVRRPLAFPHVRTPAPTQTGPYVFLSYAHKNWDFAMGVMQFLTSAGVSFWWDDGIQPGSVWDEALEERISNCCLLMACLSTDYQSSKYCRRELKFADLLGKQILPVARDPVTWSDGLRLMFQDLQIMTLNSDQSWGRLRDNLANMAADVFGSVKGDRKAQSPRP